MLEIILDLNIIIGKLFVNFNRFFQEDSETQNYLALLSRVSTERQASECKVIGTRGATARLNYDG